MTFQFSASKSEFSIPRFEATEASTRQLAGKGQGEVDLHLFAT